MPFDINLSSLNPFSSTTPASSSDAQNVSIGPSGFSAIGDSINFGSLPTMSTCYESIITFGGTVVAKIKEGCNWVLTSFKNLFSYLSDLIRGTSGITDPTPTLAERLEGHLATMNPSLTGVTPYIRIRSFGKICAERHSVQGQADGAPAALKEAFTQAWNLITPEQQHNLKVSYCKAHGESEHLHGTDEGLAWAEAQILEHGATDAFDRALSAHMTIYAEMHFATAKTVLFETPLNVGRLLTSIKNACDCNEPVSHLHGVAGNENFAAEIAQLKTIEHFPDQLQPLIDEMMERSELSTFIESLPEYRFAVINAKLGTGTIAEQVALFVFPGLHYYEDQTMTQEEAAPLFAELFNRLPDEARLAVKERAYDQYINQGGQLVEADEFDTWFDERVANALTNETGANHLVFLHGLNNHGL